MMSKDVVWWIARQIGFTGILLAVSLCMMGFAITPIGEGPVYYRIAAVLLVGIWFYQKHCTPRVEMFHEWRDKRKKLKTN